MRKAFLYSLGAIIILYVLNLLTLVVFGKSLLIERALQDTHTSYRQFQWTENVQLVSDLDLNDHQVGLFKEFYANTKAEPTYHEVQDVKELEALFQAKDTFMHWLIVDRQPGLTVYSIEETEHINEYLHSYRRTYLWVFVGWVQLYEEFLGIS